MLKKTKQEIKASRNAVVAQEHVHEGITQLPDLNTNKTQHTT